MKLQYASQNTCDTPRAFSSIKVCGGGILEVELGTEKVDSGMGAHLSSLCSCYVFGPLAGHMVQMKSVAAAVLGELEGGEQFLSTAILKHEPPPPPPPRHLSSLCLFHPSFFSPLAFHFPV